jgi:serine/threonine-protein kinase HipA
MDATVALAPAYDLVTTTAYIPADSMALTLDGSTRWPDAKRLRAFGETRGIGAPKQVRAILERIADGLADTLVELRAYARDHTAFTEVAIRIEAAWAAGIASSLASDRGQS